MSWLPTAVTLGNVPFAGENAMHAIDRFVSIVGGRDRTAMVYLFLKQRAFVGPQANQGLRDG